MIIAGNIQELKFHVLYAMKCRFLILQAPSQEMEIIRRLALDLILNYVIIVIISPFVVSSSTGYFRNTVTNRALSPSAAAKILPFIRTIPVATSNPNTSWMPFELIILQWFPRPPCGTRQ